MTTEHVIEYLEEALDRAQRDGASENIKFDIRTAIHALKEKRIPVRSENFFIAFFPKSDQAATAYKEAMKTEEWQKLARTSPFIAMGLSFN